VRERDAAIVAVEEGNEVVCEVFLVDVGERTMMPKSSAT
jgi:hypothetical protein